MGGGSPLYLVGVGGRETFADFIEQTHRFRNKLVATSGRRGKGSNTGVEGWTTLLGVRQAAGCITQHGGNISQYFVINETECENFFLNFQDFTERDELWVKVESPEFSDSKVKAICILYCHHLIILSTQCYLSFNTSCSSTVKTCWLPSSLNSSEAIIY